MMTSDESSPMNVDVDSGEAGEVILCCVRAASAEVTMITTIVIIIIKVADICWGLIMFRCLAESMTLLRTQTGLFENFKPSLLTPTRLPEYYEQI